MLAGHGIGIDTQVLDAILKVIPTVITFQMNYYKDISALSAQGDSGTNWLLTSHPDIYLYGTLVQASPYLMDQESGKIWDGLLARSLLELKISDERSTYSGGTLNMRPKYVYT